jgi:MYXO-CTERM domain-containing protein
MINYVKGYGVLAGYVALTHALGVNYWQVEPASRPWWMLGALAVLLLVPRRRQVV